jgi:hypothetical protein
MHSLTSSFDHALNKQKKPVFVFDIDSTLFNVSPRNQAIFDLFYSTRKQKDKDMLKLSSKIKLTPQDWGLRPFLDPLISADENEIEMLKKSTMSFWRKHFFAGTFLHSDQPYPEALNWVKKLASRGAHILYVTGRDDHRMRKGTLAQLKHWGFTLKKDEDLITKPQKGLEDGPYKREALLNLLKKYEGHDLFFLDNEPAVLDHCIFPEHPNYKLIFIESTHSNRSKPKRNWAKLNAFEYHKILEAL